MESFLNPINITISMETMNIPKEQFSKILNDFEVLLDDFETALSRQDLIVRKRIKDVQMNPSIGKSERELDEYLKMRGVKVDRLVNKRAS